MGKGKSLASIDIGSTTIRVVIVENSYEEGELPRVIGVGQSLSNGLRRGSVIDIEELAKSISTAVEQAELMAGESVSHVNVSLGGHNVKTQESKGVIAVGRADGEVSQEDIERVITAAGEVTLPLNHEIVHIIPKTYRLDDQMDIKDPLGMQGVRLEVDAMIIQGFAPQMKNLLKCLRFAGLEAETFVLSPLAASESVLDKKRKELGCVLIDIGGSTTSIAVYEEGDLLHTAVIPIGAGHITNDIAIGIRTSIDIAETVKLQFGTALPEDVDKNEDIDLSEIESSEHGEVSRYHIAEIIEARLEEILDGVNEELKKIHREGLLPAGAILVGGGAKLPGIVDTSKKVLRLPVTVGYPLEFGGLLDKVDDPGYAVATGLIKWQLNQMDQEPGGLLQNLNIGRHFSGNVGNIGSKVQAWIKKFLP